MSELSLHIEKLMRIVNDLINFCHEQGGQEFQVFIKDDEKISSVTITCPIKNLPQTLIEQITDELNIPRQHEIEQDYWELSGELMPSDGLSLVGMMVDEVKVGYRDSILYIHAWRYD